MRDLSSASAETEKCNSGRFLQLFWEGFHLPFLTSTERSEGSPRSGWQFTHTEEGLATFPHQRNFLAGKCSELGAEILSVGKPAPWTAWAALELLVGVMVALWHSWEPRTCSPEPWDVLEMLCDSATHTLVRAGLPPAPPTALGNCWGNIKAQSNFLEKHQSTWMKCVAIILLSCCIVCTVNCGLGGKQIQRGGICPHNNPAFQTSEVREHRDSRAAHLDHSVPHSQILPSSLIPRKEWKRKLYFAWGRDMTRILRLAPQKENCLCTLAQTKLWGESDQYGTFLTILLSVPVFTPAKCRHSICGNQGCALHPPLQMYMAPAGRERELGIVDFF